MSTKDPERLSAPPSGGTDEAQPRWRHDFPIDWPADRYITHRDFIKFLLLVSAGFATGQLGLVLRSRMARGAHRGTPRVAIARADDLEIGGAMVFHYPDKDTPCLLMRTAATSFLAFEQQCTHLACPVIPNIAAGSLDCPCHEGRFDLATGRPIAGPPRRPLPGIELEVHDGRIWAVGIRKGGGPA